MSQRTIQLHPNPMGDKPDAPIIEVTITDSGTGIGLGFGFPGDTRLLGDVYLDYYHGKVTLMAWDLDHISNDPLIEIVLSEDVQHDLSRWDEEV